MHRSHRVAGALVGAAVGSALAAPFAGSPPGEFSRRFPLPARGVRTEMCGEDPGRFPPSFARALEFLLARDLHTRRVGGPQGDECADLVGEVGPALDGEDVDLDGEDFAEVMRRDIDAGGDGMRAGALAGAGFGMAGIPMRWSSVVHGEAAGRSWRLADLQELAAALDGHP